MLIAERKVQVYRRTDGGDGGGGGGQKPSDSENEPREEDTPTRAYNMPIPIALLVVSVFYLLVATGDDGSGTQSFMDKIENSDSYSGLLRGTMATVILAQMMYTVQLVQAGQFVAYAHCSQGHVSAGSLQSQFRNCRARASSTRKGKGRR
jgi:hypothetical protein